jgi:hypothetical protein
MCPSAGTILSRMMISSTKKTRDKKETETSGYVGIRPSLNLKRFFKETCYRGYEN